MNKNLIIALAMIVSSGCVSTKDMNSSIENASEKAAIKTAIGLSPLYKNHCFIKGVVVQVENHPISGFSSSGTHAITYHVEYKLDGPLSPSGQVEPKKYIMPITCYGMKPEFKAGDKVEITGWMEKAANEHEN
jgi:hypothetical protein